MTTEKIDKAVSETVHENIAIVAENAAAEVEAANRNAEAIARAAVQSEHMARLNAIEEGNASWRAQMEQRLSETKAETLAALEASQVSILSKLTPPPAPVVETPPTSVPVPVNLEEPTRKEEPKPPSQSSPNESPKRKRVLL